MEFIMSLTHFGISSGSEILKSVSKVAAATLVSSIWQSAVIAAALALALKLAPRSTARLRFALWAVAFGSAILLPFLPLLIQQSHGQSEAIRESGRLSSNPLWVIDIRWSIAIVCLWACASVCRAVDLARHAVRLRKLWKSAKPIRSTVFTCFGRPKAVELCTSIHLDRPSVLGFLSPRILIPEWLYARLTPGELDQVILHETEHLQRLDDWTNLLQKLSLVLFPLNPVLIWIDKQLSFEREMACDDGVVRRTSAPRAYATCLANLAERGLQHRAEALSLGVWHRRPELARRIHSILLKKRTLNPVAATALLLTLGGSVIAGSFELACCPQFIAFAPKFEPTRESFGQNFARSGEAGSRVRSRYLQTSYVEGATPIAGASGTRMLNLKAVEATPPMEQLQGSNRVLPTRRKIGNPQGNTGKEINARRTEETGQTRHQNYEQAREIAINESDLAKTDPIHSSKSRPQFIVFTTWEQTLIRPAQDETFSDAADQQEPSMEGQSEAHQTTAERSVANEFARATNPVPDKNPASHENASPQSVYRTTITRLILRVIPTTTTSVDGVSVRSSWLVFKL